MPLLIRDVIKKAVRPDNVICGYVDVDNAKLYYEEVGRGEPLIFIHGHSFDLTEWEPQVQFFANKFRVITYDCRGYGRSTSPIEGMQFMHVEDLIVLMDSLKIAKAHLVGLSMGGFIITDMLALHQDRILTATAASGDIFLVPGPDEPWTEAGISRRREEIHALMQRGTMYQKWEWLDVLMRNGGSTLGEIRRPVWDMIYKWDQWQPLHVEPRLFLGNLAVEMLQNQEISVPVMVLTGEVDKNRMNKLLESVPNTRQVIIPNAGHVSNLEQPDEFNRLVLNLIMSRNNKE